ncbi:MAG TPA: type I-E CRISPR-associated protein Cas5/CasD [Chloroflexota bacterium]|nr:type I-E CRISPR-associated protein Cas5/CasD [Chloroflexota bacterium]
MQSWGTQSRFSDRDTGYEPSKSGVLGLLCAALGRPRSADLSDLTALRMGVRVDRPGALARDYQAVGAGYPEVDKRGKPTGKKTEAVVVAHRSYLADASFLVGLEGEPALLRELDAALRRPRWQLYLGRKAFVPSQPVPRGLRDLPLHEALSDASEPASERATDRLLVIESSTTTGTQVRLDTPLSFSERIYTPRHVTVEVIP